MPRFAPRILLCALVAVTGCATTGGRLAPANGHTEVGIASYYSRAHHGRKTASGVRYDERDLTAAHRSLPFGTRVRVTNLGNGRTVVVTITDRGPFARGRILDVSYRAARDLDFVRAGTARVRLEVLSG